METQEVAESPMEDKSRTPVEPQTEPQVENDADANKNKQKKKKKKKKSRRKSLERTQSEVEEMQQTEQQQAEDNPEPEEEGDEHETNQKQQEASIEEVKEVSIEDITVVEEASIEDTTVTEEASIEVTEEASVEETTVETTAAVPVETTTVQETFIEETTVETTKESAVVEEEDRHEDEHWQQEADASGDELGPPSLERKTSLDSFKATGTRAVGSLFSRFKVGRKKPLPSRTESAAKLELVNPSPVKTAVKRLEVPEEKNLDDLPMRTKRDFFGEGEQTIHVSAEKEKYNKMEAQRRADEAVRAAAAAKQTPPSSSGSNEDLLAQISDAVEDEIVANISGVEPPVEKQVTESTETRVSGVSDTVVEVSTSEAREIVVDAATVTTGESGVLEAAEPEVAQTVLDSELAGDTVVEENGKNADTTTTVPVSFELDLDLDVNTTKNESLNSIEKVFVDTTETVDEAVESNEIVQEESSSNDEILTVKVAPPASDVGTEVSPPAKPERMSPVKSLASRFEGKREQSLDSLKFRTVREFFPEERSIRVGAEKQKYEALKEQQKLKAKAEEEAKQKYNISKSPVKEIVAASTSTQRDTAVSTETESTIAVNPAAVADVLLGAGGAAFSTPETVASRKKFSFDEGYAGTNSPAKFSNDASEALTPVKSIASRFEGKREQSLDSLKFRTVREFFPEERSVRVGSEKQKFEAQALAQQENSLDKLKFRTVREFFPSEDKRSVHVGAEKARFEALTKLQGEAAKEAEQLKQKHAAVSPPPPAVEIDLHDAVPAPSETIQVSPSTLDESHAEIEPNSTQSALDPTFDETTKPVNESGVESITEISDSESNEVGLAATSLLENIGVTLSSASNGHESASKEKISSEVDDNQLDTTGGAESNESVVADEVEDFKWNTVEVTASPVDSVEEIERIVEQKVKQDAEQQVKDETGSDLKKDSEPKCEIEEEQHDKKFERKITEVDQKAKEHVGSDAKLGEMDVKEHVVKPQTGPESDDTCTGTDLHEQATINTLSTQQESVAVMKTVAGDGLVKLDLGEPVVIEPVKAVVSTPQDVIDTEVQDVGAQPIEKKPEVESGLVDLDLRSPTAEQPDVALEDQTESKSRPMLTTERSFVMEDDHTIETEDTVVVSERPMTDGEDEFELLSPSKVRSASELFTGISSTSTKKSSTSVKKTSSNDSKMAPKLTRKVSASSTGSAKSSTTVPVPMKRASITAPTASSMAKKAAEAEELHKSSPQLKKKVSASKLKGIVSDTGFIKPPPAAPTVPVAMKRASITAPTASYKAKKAAEAEDARRTSTQPKQRHSMSKQKGTVSETGFIKPPQAAPTVPVPMKRASVTAPTASWQARHVVDLVGEEGGAHATTRNHTTKAKGTPLPIPAPQKRASIMAPTASYMAKKSAENAGEDRATTSSVSTRNKRYSNVKSKVLEGIESGSMHAVTHKTITKEEFIAAERRKSLGSAGVRSLLDAVDRRASLSARVTIDGPPEPFLRSASSRKKLDSTVPRYMNYENTPGYAERARLQYERRKRLEEENTAKSEKRQRELRMHFAEKQQKALKLSAEEVRRGLEAHEFSRLAKESEIAAQKALRKEKQRASSTRSHHRPSSTTSGSSSNGFASRTSKKSSVSSVEGKVVAMTSVESSVLETGEVAESAPAAVVETIESPQEEVVTEVQEVTIEEPHVEDQTSPEPLIDEDPALEHVAKKIDFDEASSDSDEKGSSSLFLRRNGRCWILIEAPLPQQVFSTMGNWLSSIVDSVLDLLYDLSEQPRIQSLINWRSKSKRKLFQEKLQPQVTAALRHKSVVRASLLVPGPEDVPKIFTSARPFNVEWNLCNKVDPARRVDVVGDHKLLRKRMKGLFVDKSTRLHVHCDTRTLAQNDLEIMCYIANFCETYKVPIHRNVVHLLGYYTASDRLHEIIEFCELGSLMSAYIESPQEGLRLTFSSTEGEVCDAMYQICTGLQFLHGHGIAHGNLGLENIFVTSENILKIGDFEYSVFVGSDNQHQPLPKLPTPPQRTYMAPEIEASKLGERLDLQKADVWSVGIIFILLLTKKPLFDAAKPDDNGFQMFSRVGLRSYLKVMYLEQSAICKLSEELLEFAEGLLHSNPKLRFTMNEALENNWLKTEKGSSRHHSRTDSMTLASIRSEPTTAHSVSDETE